MEHAQYFQQIRRCEILDLNYDALVRNPNKSLLEISKFLDIPMLFNTSLIKVKTIMVSKIMIKFAGDMISIQLKYNYRLSLLI